MPINAVAALMYPFFLIPGLIFLNRSETHLPKRKRSVFRETATVVFASVGSAALVLLLYVVASLCYILPIQSFANFTANPAAVFSHQPRASVAGMLAFLLLSSLIAWFAASRRVYSLVKGLLWAGSGDDVHGTTAWQDVLMPSTEDKEVIVGVQLKSGIWVQGVHDAHSDVEEEDGDRQLILRSPLRQRFKDEEETKELNHFDRVVIQASEIDYLASFERQP